MGPMTETTSIDEERLGTNWAGNLTYSASSVHHPRSVEELQEIVAAAPLLRALGSRHSFNAVADTRGAHVSTGSLPDVFVLDADARTVTPLSGSPSAS